MIFAPILLIVAWRQKHSIKKWLQAILITAGIIMLLTAPFANGEPFSWLFNLYKDKVFGWQLHLITANAFNLWAALTGIHEQKDTLMFGALSYNHWGYVLFTATMIPVLIKLYKNPSENNILWSSMLAAFSSFVFLTGMHERYLYPIFPVLTLIVAQRKKLLVSYAIISLVHLVNLYNFWWYPKSELIIGALSAYDRILPRILGALMTLMFIYIYMQFFKQKETSRI